MGAAVDAMVVSQRRCTSEVDGIWSVSGRSACVGDARSPGGRWVFSASAVLSVSLGLWAMSGGSDSVPGGYTVGRWKGSDGNQISPFGPRVVAFVAGKDSDQLVTWLAVDAFLEAMVFVTGAVV
jgi:hypothetical protein